MRNYAMKLKILASVSLIWIPVLVTGCENSIGYSNLYKDANNKPLPNLTPEQVSAQKADGFAKQIQSLQPIADATGPLSSGIAPLAVSIAGNLAMVYALLAKKKAEKSANKSE